MVANLLACSAPLPADLVPMGLSIDRIAELARKPAPFDLPEPSGTSEQAAADWQEATRQVEQEAEAKAARRATGSGATVNRTTLDFIRQGANVGDRHRLLFCKK